MQLGRPIWMLLLMGMGRRQQHRLSLSQLLPQPLLYQKGKLYHRFSPSLMLLPGLARQGSTLLPRSLNASLGLLLLLLSRQPRRFASSL